MQWSEELGLSRSWILLGMPPAGAKHPRTKMWLAPTLAGIWVPLM